MANAHVARPECGGDIDNACDCGWRRDVDPRDPDHSREGMFVNHNCYRCRHGAMPCVNGHMWDCEYPHARND